MKKFNKKNICFLVAVVVFTMSILFVLTYNKEVETEDTIVDEAPKVTVLENNLIFLEDDEIDFLKYIRINEKDDSYVVEIKNEENARKAGKHFVEIVVTNESLNKTTVFLNVNIISKEEWTDYIASTSNIYIRRNRLNDNLIEYKGLADYEAYKLAEEFIGMEGSCADVAQAYIDKYFGEGYNVFKTYNISMEEAEPGDIIFYEDAGNGEVHYAVYLGGFSALQGNVNGQALIGFVYLRNGSEPIFQRLIGR